MKTAPRLATLRLILTGLLLLLSKATLDLYGLIQALGVVFFPSSQMWLLLFGLSLTCLIVLIALILTWTRQRKQMLSVGSRVVQILPSARWVVLSLLVILVVVISLAVLFPWGVTFGMGAFRWLVVGIVLILVILLLRRYYPSSNWLNLMAVAGLIVAGVYRLCQFLPDISVYPFSLGWSEASRYYYASLFFSEKIYGQAVPPSTLHPTRYLMQAVPFLIKTLPLLGHRVWQVLLWLAGLFGTAIILGRRLKITSKSWRWLFSVWVFLFLWQGPVYYHLLVIVILVLWGFDRQRPWRTLFIVALASIWAGISRVNWYPVPGMLAAALYFLEQPFGRDDDDEVTSLIPLFRAITRYLFQPVLWVVAGTLIALGSQSIYILWSGNDPGQFASSFSSALLWYRLLPNSTYSLGILTGAIVISLPIFFLVGYRYRIGSVRLQPIVLLGLGSILLVLLVGGLVVSVKIGGGSNLHNLDAYLTLLLVVGSFFYFRHIPLFSEYLERPQRQVPAWLNLFIVTIPVLFSLKSASHFVQYNPTTVADSLLKMQNNINRALEDGGEILFISERQLLTFDTIHGVTLVPEYEKVFLMEMVMAGNQSYLGAFQDDIRRKRFDLIITDPLFDSYKESGESWSEENNVWVESVSVPILCHYWRKVTFPESGVQIMAPREKEIDCDTVLESNPQE